MNNLNRQRLKHLISTGLNALGWLGGLFFLVAIWRQASVVNWSINAIQWPLFAMSFALLFIGQALQSQLAWITQHFLGRPIEPARIYRIWFFSQVTKYIPGSLWQVATRSVMYIRQGSSIAEASTATVWELLATITGSLIVCIFSVTARAEWLLVSLSAFALVVPAIAFFMTWPWQVFARLRIQIAQRMIDLHAWLKQRRYPMLFTLLLLSTVVWLIIGTGFYMLVLAFYPNTEISWWNALISFNIAYSIGFLFIVAPTGLGIREVVLTLLLASYIDPAGLAVFVLVARFWWIAAEGVNLAIAGVAQFLQRTRVVAQTNGAD